LDFRARLHLRRRNFVAQPRNSILAQWIFVAKGHENSARRVRSVPGAATVRPYSLADPFITPVHNWDDVSAVRLLRNCHRALGPNGKLVLVEMIVPSDNRAE
jgi:SAM-dependent methyltransferase